MGIQLLKAAVAGTTGPSVDVRSIAHNLANLRIDAMGGFGGSAVIIEHSPDGGVSWIQVGTLTNGQELTMQNPVDLIRARTDGSLTGNATVWMDVSA